MRSIAEDEDESDAEGGTDPTEVEDEPEDAGIDIEAGAEGGTDS